LIDGTYRNEGARPNLLDEVARQHVAERLFRSERKHLALWSFTELGEHKVQIYISDLGVNIKFRYPFRMWRKKA